jgi:hypothetical protein
MDLEPTIENLSEAFGLQVPRSLAGLVQVALGRCPARPSTGLAPLRLVLGGALYGFVAGPLVSLRFPQTPPEMFPFAQLQGHDTYYGLVIDDPERAAGEERFVVELDPEGPQGCRLKARNIPEFLAVRLHEALEEARAGRGGLSVKELEKFGESLRECLDLPWPVDPTQVRREAEAARAAQVTYATEDRLGVVVPDENAPFELLTIQMRRALIDTRDRQGIYRTAKRALSVGAPGAALALARDLLWNLGHRPEWYREAVDLMEQIYPSLGRPLLARVVRREWARYYGQGRG